MAEVVGFLRTNLGIDSSEHDAGLQRASASIAKYKTAVTKGLGEAEVAMSRQSAQAARLEAALRGDKLLQYANALTASIQKVGGATKLTDAEQARHNVTLQKAIDKYRVLGQEAPKAMVDLERATRKAVQPTEQLAGSMTQMSTTSKLASGAMGALKGQFGTVLAGFAAFNVLQMASSGLVSLVKGAFDSASALVDLSNKTGIGTETLQRMEFVAGQTGGTLEGFADTAYKLGIRLSGGSSSVRGAVKELGLELGTLKAMQPGEMWETVVSALGHVEDATTRNRLGQELMGKSYANIAVMGNEAYDEIAKGATVLADHQLRELERMADSWDKFADHSAKQAKSFFANVVLGVTQTTTKIGDILAAGGRMANLSPQDMSKLLNSGKTPVEYFRDVDTRAALQQKGAKGGRVGQAAGGSEAKSFVEQLKDIDEQLRHLSKADRAEIDAAMQLGDQQAALEEKYGLTDAAMRRYQATMKESSKAAKAASGDSKKIADELEKVDDAAHSAADSVWKINDSLAALSERQGDLEAIESLQRVKGIDDFLRAEVDRQDELDRLADEDERRMADDERRDREHIQKRREAIDDELDQQAQADKARAEAFSQRWVDAAANVMQVVAHAMQAASSGIGAQNAAVSTGMAAMSMAGPYGSAVASVFGGGVAAIDARNDKVSGQTRSKIAYGDFLRMIAMTTAASVQGSSLQIRANKAVTASYLEIGLTAEDAVGDLARLHQAAGESAEAYNKALDRINENLRRQADLTDARRQKQDLLNQAVERYGFTFEEAGRLFQRGGLAQQAEQLQQDWQLLVESGADPAIIAQRMAGAASAFVQGAVKTGTEIPESLRPMLTEMQSLGLLLDENGQSFRVEMLKFGAQLESMFARTLDRLNALIDELKRPPNTPIPRRSGPTVEDDLEGRSHPRRAHRGYYIGGSEVPIVAQTHEAVMNRMATRMMGGKFGVDAFNAGNPMPAFASALADPMAGLAAALDASRSPWSNLPLGRTSTTAAWSASSGGGAEGPVSVNATVHVHGIQDPAQVSREIARRLPMEISRNTHGVRSKLRRQLRPD